jgi:hypothetical protein
MEGWLMKGMTHSLSQELCRESKLATRPEAKQPQAGAFVLSVSNWDKNW